MISLTLRGRRLIPVLLAGVLALQSSASAVGTRKIPFIGYYYIVSNLGDYKSQMVGRYNLDWMVDWHAPLDSPAFAQHYINNGIKVMLHVGITREWMINATGEYDAHLLYIKSRLQASALYPGGPSMLEQS